MTEEMFACARASAVSEKRKGERENAHINSPQKRVRVHLVHSSVVQVRGEAVSVGGKEHHR